MNEASTTPRRANLNTWSGLALGIVLAAAIFSGWFVWLRPTILGGPASYVVVSGVSMEPALRSGDLALLRQEPTYEPGDIVVYRADNSLIIHRIRDGSDAEGYVVQGDNRQTADAWRPNDEDIVGRMWLRVPAVGSALDLVKSPGILAALAVTLLVCLTWARGIDRGLHGAMHFASRLWHPPLHFR